MRTTLTADRHGAKLYELRRRDSASARQTWRDTGRRWARLKGESKRETVPRLQMFPSISRACMCVHARTAGAQHNTQQMLTPSLLLLHFSSCVQEVVQRFWMFLGATWHLVLRVRVWSHHKSKTGVWFVVSISAFIWRTRLVLFHLVRSWVPGFKSQHDSNWEWVPPEKVLYLSVAIMSHKTAHYFPSNHLTTVLRSK